MRKRTRSNSRKIKIKTNKYESRPSPPYSAKDYKNKTLRGNDGNNWTSLPDKNGVYHWKKEQDDQDFIELVSEISKKIANSFWIKLATGGLLLIYNDSTYEILENVSKKEYQTLVNDPDPEIEYIVFVPISRDALNFFVVFLLSKLSKKDIQFIMCKKDSILDMITEDPKFFLEKTFNIGKKMYTFRGIDEEKINKKKIIERLQRL